MRGITLHEPYASLIAADLKQYETRSWSTSYRGPLLIHAAKRRVDVDDIWNLDSSLASEWDRRQMFFVLGKDRLYDPILSSDFPYGHIVAYCKLADCIQMTETFIAQQTPLERSVGCWAVGRWAWKLERIIRCNPFPAKGAQGLWSPKAQGVEEEFIAEVQP